MKSQKIAPNASELAAQAAESVPYQGRKVQRRRSEARRNAILEAALSIIVRDGVRAVRHRAVATEAQVPLSATTYYFDTIDELIGDSFALYAEQNAERLSKFWRGASRLLTLSASGSAAEQRLERQQRLANWLAKDLLSRLKHQREQLLIAQAFGDEALRNPRLAQLLAVQQHIRLTGFADLLRQFGGRDPDLGAQLLTSLLAQLEYQGLLQPAALKPAMLKQQLQQSLSLLLAK